MTTSFSFRCSPPATSAAPSFLAAASLPTRHRPLLPKRSVKFGVKCNYSGYGVAEESIPSKRDVAADARHERVVVLGGNGFIGSSICEVAIANGMEVTSLNRSGRPALSAPWVDQVNWVAGDVFHVNWDQILVGATAVVSAIGGFGSEEQMQRVNGEANIVAVNAAKDFGVPKFIMISIHDHNLPPNLLQFGYFTGKRKAESEVLSKYPNSGVIFRPGLVYGKRRVSGFEIPMDLIGEPMEKILHATENFTGPLNSLPGSSLFLTPPISVNDLACAVVHAVTDDNLFGIFTIQQIKEAAAKVKA